MDLNNDGKKDIIAGSYFGSIHWFSGTDTEEYHNEGVIYANDTIFNCIKFSHPALADMNNDGLIDLLVTGEKKWIKDGIKYNFALLYNTGTKENYKYGAPLVFKEDGGFSLNHHPAAAVQFIDINKDSLLDLVASENVEGQIKYYENIGSKESPVFDNPFTLTTGEGSKTWLGYMGNSNPEVKHEVCDWNGDGVWDILFGGNNHVKRLYISYGVSDKVSKPLDYHITSTENSIQIEIINKNQILLSNKTNNRLTYSIYNLKGKKSPNKIQVNNNDKLIIKGFLPGVYIIGSISKGKSFSKKIVIH